MSCRKVSSQTRLKIVQTTRKASLDQADSNVARVFLEDVTTIKASRECAGGGRRVCTVLKAILERTKMFFARDGFRKKRNRRYKRLQLRPLASGGVGLVRFRRHFWGGGGVGKGGFRKKRNRRDKNAEGGSSTCMWYFFCIALVVEL